ncbi:MAG: HAD family hydrolase [Dehalococcoidia bacterium]|nr:HAD family hydrolase [Dehalococcoidia bacterium]
MQTSLSGVRAILYDLDETLVPDDAKVVRALETTVATLRGREYFLVPQVAQAVLTHACNLWQAAAHYPRMDALGVSAWEALWARFEGEDPPMPHIRSWVLEAYRPAVWEGLLEALEIVEDGLADQLDLRFQAERRALGAELFSETTAVLDALGARRSLGLVTNGLSCLQREKITAAGLTARFGAIAVSGEVGYGKPRPEPFLAALARLAVPPEAAIMVGDSLTRDVAGAHAVGMRAVWVNRAGKARGQGPVPDYEVADLTGLLELLRD